MTSSISRVAHRYLLAAGAVSTRKATDVCVVCGAPGEVLRYTVKGAPGTRLQGRIFVKGTALCDSHQEMLEGI